jgi:hypothetical protein
LKGRPHVNIVICRPISRQRSKYAHGMIENALQVLFSVWSAPCPLLGNGSLNTFPQKRTVEQWDVHSRQRSGKHAYGLLRDGVFRGVRARLI